MFNDFWMHDQGFMRGPNKGDLRDVIGRSHEEGSTVGIAPTDSLLVAYSRTFEASDFSSLWVIEGISSMMPANSRTPITSTVMSVLATTDAVRGPWSSSASSPTQMPGPMLATLNMP